MKTYPSIIGSKYPNDKCIAFKKYDGSNLRWEWRRKKGFFKFGTRTRLFDESDEIFGEAIKIFFETYAEKLEKIFIDKKLQDPITSFTEFFGPKSFAGIHDPTDKKELVLFDVCIYKKGLIDPVSFIKIFDKIKIAEVIYTGNLNEKFVQDVRNSLYPVIEGVVCKGGKGHKLWMRKIKTYKYLELLKERFSGDWTKYWE